MSVINQSLVGSDPNASGVSSSVVSGATRGKGSVSFFDLLAAVPEVLGGAQSGGSAEAKNVPKVSSSDDIASDDSLQNAQLFLEVVTKRRVNDNLDGDETENFVLGAGRDVDTLVSELMTESIHELKNATSDFHRTVAFIVNGIKKVLEASPVNSASTELGVSLALDAVTIPEDDALLSFSEMHGEGFFSSPTHLMNLISALEKKVIRELPNETSGDRDARTVSLKSMAENSFAIEDVSQQFLLIKVYVNEAGSNNVAFINAALGEGRTLSSVSSLLALPSTLEAASAAEGEGRTLSSISSRLALPSALEVASAVDNDTLNSNTHLSEGIELAVSEVADTAASKSRHNLTRSALLESALKNKSNSEGLSLTESSSVTRETADSEISVLHSQRDISVEYTPDAKIDDAETNAASLDIRFDAVAPKLIFVALNLAGEGSSPTSEVILNFLQGDGIKTATSDASGVVKQLYEADEQAVELMKPLNTDELDVDNQHIKFPKMMLEKDAGSWLSTEIQSDTVMQKNTFPEALSRGDRLVAFEKMLRILKSTESITSRKGLADIPSNIRNMSNLITRIDQIVKNSLHALSVSKTSVALKATSAQYIASQFSFSKGSGSIRDYFNKVSGFSINEHTNANIAVFELTDADSLMKQSRSGSYEAEKARNVSLAIAENMGAAKLPSSLASPRYASVLPQQALSLNDPNFAPRLTALALEQALNASEPIEINLDPKSFGKIRVNARLDGANFEVQLSVENTTTLSVMRSSEGLLSHLSEQNGLRLSQYNVDLGAGGHSGSNQNEGNQGAGDNSRATSPDIEKEGLIALEGDEADTDGLNLIA